MKFARRSLPSEVHTFYTNVVGYEAKTGSLRSPRPTKFYTNVVGYEDVMDMSALSDFAVLYERSGI